MYTYVRYVPDTYVPGISRQKSIRTYVMFRPWTHMSDDSYIYQLSLVVATATVSLTTTNKSNTLAEAFSAKTFSKTLPAVSQEWA